MDLCTALSEMSVKAGSNAFPALPLNERNLSRKVFAIRYDDVTDKTYFLIVKPDQKFMWVDSADVLSANISNTTGFNGEEST